MNLPFRKITPHILNDVKHCLTPIIFCRSEKDGNALKNKIKDVACVRLSVEAVNWAVQATSEHDQTNTFVAYLREFCHGQVVVRLLMVALSERYTKNAIIVCGDFTKKEWQDILTLDCYTYDGDKAPEEFLASIAK